MVVVVGVALDYHPPPALGDLGVLGVGRLDLLLVPNLANLLIAVNPSVMMTMIYEEDPWMSISFRGLTIT